MPSRICWSSNPSCSASCRASIRPSAIAALASSHFRLLPVAGTYFQLADYSALSNEPDLEFARKLAVEVGVAVIPVSPFYERQPDQRIVRFCFAKNDSTLDHAAARLCELTP